jgi:Fe(3+) dicitrate transport protein
MTRDEAYRATAVSGFLQDEITAGDWSFVPGVRAERYTQSRQRVFPTVDPKEEEKRSVLLPGVSVLYNGYADTQLFASVERGYTPAIARGSSFPLRPEIGINSQVGQRTQPAAGFSMEAAVFYNRRKDTLVQLPFIDPDTFASVFVNEADSRAFGVDLGTRLDSSAFTGSALNVFAQVAWNYTNAKFTRGDSRGNRVPEIPLHAGSLTLGLEHSAGWHASLTLSHAGRFFTDPANTVAPILVGEDCIEDAECEPLQADDAIDLREPIVLGAVPSRTLLSARVSYRLSGTGATLWVQGRNLTGKDYVADYQNGMRPGAPRTVVAGVSVVFR